MLCALALLAHWGACLWYSGDGAEAWVHAYVPHGEPHEQYAYALYFSLTTLTTVGFGDITPTSVEEVLVVILLLSASVTCFASACSVLITLGVDAYEKRSAKRRYVAQVGARLAGAGLPAPLRARIQSYHAFLWDRREAAQDLASLPTDLRDQASRSLCPLRRAPCLAWADDRACAELRAQSELLVCGPGEELLQSRPDRVLFLVHGVVRAGGAELSAPCVLGEARLFGGAPQYAAVAAATCECRSLSVGRVSALLRRHPEWQPAFDRCAASPEVEAVRCVANKPLVPVAAMTCLQLLLLYSMMVQPEDVVTEVAEP